MLPSQMVLVNLNTIFIVVAILFASSLVVAYIIGHQKKDFSNFKKILLLGGFILLFLGIAIMLITYKQLSQQ